MNKNELIKQCRYYKGEKECPYDRGSKQAFWGYEEAWVDMMLEQDDYLAECVDEYRKRGLSDFEKNDKTPLSLKAILFNRYEYWCEGTAEDFMRFYKEQYLGD